MGELMELMAWFMIITGIGVGVLFFILANGEDE
jgi:hypothetical protein